MLSSGRNSGPRRRTPSACRSLHNEASRLRSERGPGPPPYPSPPNPIALVAIPLPHPSQIVATTRSRGTALRDFLLSLEHPPDLGHGRRLLGSLVVPPAAREPREPDREPAPSRTKQLPAVWTGFNVISAPRTSRTTAGSNHASASIFESLEPDRRGTPELRGSGRGRSGTGNSARGKGARISQDSSLRPLRPRTHAAGRHKRWCSGRPGQEPDHNATESNEKLGRARTESNGLLEPAIRQGRVGSS